MQPTDYDRPSSGESLSDKVDSAIQQGKAGANRLADEVQNQLKGFANTRKDAAADQIGGVAGILRDSGDDLADQAGQPWISQYADQAAASLEDAAIALERKDIGELIGDLEDFAHRQPAIFIGGAVLAGLLLGRFIKASEDREPEAERPSTQRSA